jgi:hypothetical protein
VNLLARPRIASLVPSLTELLVAAGLAELLVARTGYCIHPADVVRRIPKVGGTKTVNLRKLRHLAPTHVLVNVDENRLDTVQALREFVPHLIVTHPCAPQHNFVLLEQIDSAFGGWPGVRERTVALRAELQLELARTHPAGRAAQAVLYLIWRDPWMTIARDTYISRMLQQVHWLSWPELDGGPHGAARYPVLRGDEPWLARIDQVLLSSEPYAFGEADIAAAGALCPNAGVRLVDGELLSWYGPRAAAGLRYLRTLAEPDRPQRAP